MRIHRRLGELIWCSLIILAAAISAVASDNILVGTPVRQPVKSGDNQVIHKCLTPDRSELHSFSKQLGLDLQRRSPWSLPQQALQDDQQVTINILVLRYNFQYEEVDDPNTTGRGEMNLSRLVSVADSNAYYDSVGHWIDPPPHNADYFDAHLRALNYYWNWVSEGHIQLTWDIFPPVSDSAYTLPHPMNYYGKCDSVVVGLERYFVDAIQLADTVHTIDPLHPNIDFSEYNAAILFHAGSDRQNDIGFPPTCSDLFTGFIKFGDSIAVNNDSGYVRTALMMPETASQDNRATALNAVLAHEFGHQLGLVDLYRTDNFLSQLGDFSLMDNNGFSTGIDYGFTVGQVFGAIPVFPDAWSRAYLGFVPVVDFRQGSDIRIVAAEVVSSGIKMARIPISEHEYYLIENRVVEVDGEPTAAQVDSLTNVILRPTDTFKVPTGEYDFLIPGSGMLIYLVDEGVAPLDYDGDGLNNFDDNDLQSDPNRKFVTLVEADGFVNFGGYYRAGYGRPEDMFREDRQHAFTPNTNPPAIDNSGNNTRVFVTDITRDSIQPPGARQPTYLDTVMLFDLETDKLARGFPTRIGQPQYLFSPIVADVNADGNDEILVVSGKQLLAVTTDGRNFLLDVADTCTACPRRTDTTVATVHAGRTYPVPVYYEEVQDLTATPVVGRMGLGDSLLVAIARGSESSGTVRLFAPYDLNNDGLADGYGRSIVTTGRPIAMSFGEDLWVLTNSGYVYHRTDTLLNANVAAQLTDSTYHGLARFGENLVVLSGDAESTTISVIDSLYVLHALTLEHFYSWGPVAVDMDRDGLPEIVVASPDGWLAYVTVDTSTAEPSLSLMGEFNTGFQFTTNPIAGDVDIDGRADVIIGGQNAVFAFGQHGFLKTDFPLEVNDRFPADSVISAPIHTEIEGGDLPELIFPTQIGNIYAFGLTETYGFPLSGGELGVGSPIVFKDSLGARLGYYGVDGWLYAWEIVTDSARNYWPMYGQDATGSFTLPTSALGPLAGSADDFRDEQFYNYPNPVTDGRTAFRYTLGDAANDVTIAVFDLSGVKIADLKGTTASGDNELQWSCGDVTPGVYRCRIQIDFDGDTRTAFHDVAIIR